MHPMLTIARRAADEAGKVIQRGYRELNKIQIHEKGRGDFVSIVDQQAEQVITNVLIDKYPDHAILGEEFGASADKEADYQWVIDPLDGTANFVHGLPHFSVSIGLLKKGVPEIGIVYNPITDDWFTAEKGGGAQLNGQRIRANTQRDPGRAVVATGFPYKDPELMPEQLAYVKSVLEDFSDLRRMGGAALDFCLTACGRQDAFFELGLRPWDMAAGILIAQEAGCIVTDFSGEKNMLENGTIICANAHLYPVLDKALQRARRNLLNND
ncbi:inositol monophosphatase family protein [Suttonella ornithocola]|uniref:Inositol-1-monophosphatase n=1 Tax=Suttonella ornithocola TaxID=279832 RepID=A0A380N1W8_9GAMM|nr:inositol monophosphatase family protein [Suttonella ornithocola]SUO97757.1 Inositol-1-monophosphatase [Suttonella ornithocola]